MLRGLLRLLPPAPVILMRTDPCPSWLEVLVDCRANSANISELSSQLSIEHFFFERRCRTCHWG